MVTPAILKYFLTDSESLAQYVHGEFVEFRDITRHMFLKAREQNRAIPDHYYRLEKESGFTGMDSITSIFTEGLPRLAENFLEMKGKRVYVKLGKQNEWQEMLTYLPPLFMQCALLHKELVATDPVSVRQFFSDYLLPNTKFTAIPSACIPQLDHFVDQQQGLHDLHMHLNGALETDRVWQDFLASPKNVYHELRSSFLRQKVREQLEQESNLLRPDDFYKLLNVARKLRVFFLNYLFPGLSLQLPGRSRSALLWYLNNEQFECPDSSRHPFLYLLNWKSGDFPYLMSVEGLMYVLLLVQLKKGNETLANLFHYYLLILGLANRLLVQQTHQNGFEQFQKHTLNGLREASEKTYLRRYHQMHGNDGRYIRFLEGRFSPKKTQKELIAFIDAIWTGWEKLSKSIRNGEFGGNRSVEGPDLRLIAHFIKEADNHKDPLIRHKELRYNIWKRGKVLSILLSKHEKYRRKVTAVDAAASEFDAPPEVFAPLFRMMRRSGVKHFTYHAGEDFYHILSGLRAVYEAIEFCGLQRGDRIGHATATGLSVELWHREVGDTVIIRQGEYLDNLIFAYHFILVSANKVLNKLIPFIANEIHKLCFEVYGRHYPVAVLQKAWLMRQYCPVHVLADKKNDIVFNSVFDENEWELTTAAGCREKSRYDNSSPVLEVFYIYHTLKFRESFDKIITIDPFGIIGKEELQILQLEILADMNEREIVIETLPTSNVRIGFHRNYSSYHLWNWISWRKEGKSIPPIVVGSDDTGIFATNIYNEYANIYGVLLNEHKLSHNDVMEIIKDLDRASRIYRFM